MLARRFAFWVQERWPAGDYPLQSTGGQGLAKWTQRDRPVGPGEDPVVWYCFGVTHIPRCIPAAGVYIAAPCLS